MRTAIVLILLALAGAAGSDKAAAQQATLVPTMCQDCHGAPATGKLTALTHADSVSCLTCHHIGYTNDPDSARARRIDACTGCHTQLPGSHVGIEAPAAECTACHSIHSDPPMAEAQAAISGRCTTCHTDRHPLHADVGPQGPECTQCHTSHTGHRFSPQDPTVVQACTGCHEAPHPSHTNVEGGFACTQCHTVTERPDPGTLRDTAGQECASCHTSLRPAHTGHVATDGREVTCLECHDFDAPPLSEGTGAMATRCGTCHQDEQQGVMDGGHALVKGGPNCLTCHISHVESGESEALTRLTATVRCLECHSGGLQEGPATPASVAASYTDDFHGTTLQFLASHQSAGADYPPVMVCSDCHGAHAVGWSDADLVSDVCKRCHTDSDERFAGAWLGHKPIGPASQPLIWLVRLFYFILIPFMLAGLFLNIVFHLVAQRRSGARVMKTEGVQRILAWLRRKPRPKPTMVTRFSLTDRLDHLGSALTFIGLVVTGLPQTRPDLGIARAIIGFFGGIGTTRIVHRVIGVAFVALMVLHVGRAVINAVKRHRLPVMTPTRKDFEDVLQTFRHYLFGEKLPKVGKFDFAEKFEYWGLFLGGIVMSSTGIILMFPELLTQFLPGVVVAATRVMHGFEATFAVMVVILWHSYGVMLRPEVFPLDTSIFTGKMEKHRLKHEHALEYERLFPDEAATEQEADGEESAPSLFEGAPKGLAGA